MDFSNRDIQPGTPSRPTGVAGNPNKRSKYDKGKWTRIGFAALGGAIVILLVAVIVLISVGDKSEDRYVDTTKLQAVFLNTGQVYFGNVKALNSRYFVLTNIYYLQSANSNSSGGSSSSSTASSNVTLVKLGCELHEPYDQMVINASQVTFWENLQDNGQVAKAVATFEKQNPNGQKCADQSSSASTNSGSNAQSAGSNSGNTSTTPATKR